MTLIKFFLFRYTSVANSNLSGRIFLTCESSLTHVHDLQQFRLCDPFQVLEMLHTRQLQCVHCVETLFDEFLDVVRCDSVFLQSISEGRVGYSEMGMAEFSRSMEVEVWEVSSSITWRFACIWIITGAKLIL